MKLPNLRVSALAIALCAEPAFAQTAVYPAKQQSRAKQEKDEAECSAFARQKTGVDPAALANQAGQSQASGQVARGAVGGASTGRPGMGASVGEIGAAAGAGRKRGAEEQQQKQAQVQLNEYNSVRAACLSGRGYTVR